MDAPSGDDAYTLFGEMGTHSFLCWLGEVFSIKTPELKRTAVVAAMYATFNSNEAEARTFWLDVARGGKEYEDNAPSKVLDDSLKAIKEDKEPILKPGEYFRLHLCMERLPRSQDHQEHPVGKQGHDQGLLNNVTFRFAAFTGGVAKYQVRD